MIQPCVESIVNGLLHREKNGERLTKHMNIVHVYSWVAEMCEIQD